MKRKIIATAMMAFILISGTVDCYAAFPPVVTASWQSNYTKVPYELVSDTDALEETSLEDVVDVTRTYTEKPEEEEEPATPTDLDALDEAEEQISSDGVLDDDLGSSDEVEEQISSDEVVNFTSGADLDSVVSDTTSYDREPIEEPIDEQIFADEADDVVIDTSSLDEELAADDPVKDTTSYEGEEIDE